MPPPAFPLALMDAMLLQACSQQACQAFETSCKAQCCFGSVGARSLLDIDSRDVLDVLRM